MEKTIPIKGMMCEHCEARVKAGLEALPEVQEALVSHETGTATLRLSAALSDEALKDAIEELGYELGE